MFLNNGFSTKVPTQLKGLITVLSTNNVGIIAYPYAKAWAWKPTLSYRKFTSNRSKN